MSEIQPNQEEQGYNSCLFPKFMEREPITDYSRINDTIRKLLIAFPDACWGGSSVLHDVVLPPIDLTNKSWNTRDFDIYCLDKDNNNIISFLKKYPMVYFNMKILRITQLYDNLHIKNLTEFTIKLNGDIERKLQLINTGNYSNYSKLSEAVDLSFCSVVISNDMIYFLKTTKSDVLEKRGSLLIKKRFNSKIVRRIIKYRARGFTITNICQFCDYDMNIIEHTPNCLVAKLFNNNNLRIDGLYYILSGSNKSKLGVDEINQLIAYSNQYKKDSVILLSIYTIIVHFKQIDLLHSFWDEIKKSIDISSVMKCSQQLIREGLYTGFRLLFDFMFPHHINSVQIDERTKYISILMEIVVNHNYMQCALLIQSRIPTIELNIYEDKIFSWKQLVVYDILLELINAEDSSQNEIDSFMEMIPFIKKLETTDSAIQTICLICKYDNCSIKMTCGHSFCQNCIILQLMTTYETIKKERCPHPYCLMEYHYLTKP